MSIVARFYVSEITKHAYNAGASTVKLSAVCRGTENKTWAASTPSGTVALTISNETAAKWFEQRLGQDVAITFEDRPLVCSVCRQETDGQATGGNSFTLTGDVTGTEMKSGDTVHQACYEAQVST